MKFVPLISKVDPTELFFNLLSPFSPSISPLSFTQDIPKEYRHLSLTGVKQRFEDEAYQQISKEKVLTLFNLGFYCNSLSIFKHIMSDVLELRVFHGLPQGDGL